MPEELRSPDSANAVAAALAGVLGMPEAGRGGEGSSGVSQGRNSPYDPCNLPKGILLGQRLPGMVTCVAAGSSRLQGKLEGFKAFFGERPLSPQRGVPLQC